MVGKRISWALVSLAAIFALGLLAVPSGHAAPATPAGVRAWLGDWSTNFGEFWFYSASYSDVAWNNDGTEYSTCQQLRECHYHWFLRGLWHWPGHDWVQLKGTPTGKDFGTIEPCWEGPFSLEVPGSGNPGSKYCFAMLLYRYGDEERGGFWKACALQENCTDHHGGLHGTKVAGHTGTGGLWKVGFRFLQKGPPDGHRVISTQTGGAGSIIFPRNPDEGGQGLATEGSLVFHVNDLGAAPEPQYTLALYNAIYTADGAQIKLRALGLVTSSTDRQCPAGALLTIALYHRRNPAHPDRIELAPFGRGKPCDTDETWTSTDKRRVDIHIGAPRHVA